MKYLFLILSTAINGNALACQYGMDSSKREDELIQRLLPDATVASGDGLKDATGLSWDMFSNNCPSDFKLSGHIQFINHGMYCRGKVILKYRDNHYSRGKIKFVSCSAGDYQQD